VIDQSEQALKAERIESSKVDTELCITECGERMAISLFLPKEYEFDPGDGHPLALRLVLINSVEGRTRFRVLMGLFRLVCSNSHYQPFTEDRHRVDFLFALYERHTPVGADLKSRLLMSGR